MTFFWQHDFIAVTSLQLAAIMVFVKTKSTAVITSVFVLSKKNKNGTSYFKPINERQPDQGCIPVTNLSCDAEALKRQTFLELDNITYFRFGAQDPDDIKPDHRNITLEKCKEECRNKWWCKAAIYYYKLRSVVGDCYLES